MKILIKSTAQNAQVQAAIEQAFTDAGFKFSARRAKALLQAGMKLSEEGELKVLIVITPNRLVHNGEKWQFAPSTVIDVRGDSVNELVAQIGSLQLDSIDLGL